jgi:hypothetical protein
VCITKELGLELKTRSASWNILSITYLAKEVGHRGEGGRRLGLGSGSD